MSSDVDDHDPLRVSKEEEGEILASPPYGRITVLII